MAFSTLAVGNIGRNSPVMYVRAPATPPNITLAPPSQVRYIIFRHPGYDDARNILLKLFAPDASSSASSGIGLHAGYALAACGIVAGNRWDGWLSEHRHQNTDTAMEVEMNRPESVFVPLIETKC